MRLSENNSIFGRTQQGVANPLIPFKHAYPTRYHGPIWTVPRFMLPYVENPEAVPPYNGFGGGCGCQSSASGLGDTPLLCGVTTGNTAIDMVLGACIGYLVAPSKTDRPMYASAGAGAGALLGGVGVIALALGTMFLKVTNPP